MLWVHCFLLHIFESAVLLVSHMASGFPSNLQDQTCAIHKESSMFSNQEPWIESSITYFSMKLGSQWLHLGNIGSEFYSSTVCAWLESVELRTGPNEGINHLCMDGWQVLSLPVDMCVQYVLHGNTALQVCALAPIPLFSIKDCSSWFLPLKLQSLSFCFGEFVLSELHNQRKVYLTWLTLDFLKPLSLT
jgi:hypothetical protein